MYVAAKEEDAGQGWMKTDDSRWLPLKGSTQSQEEEAV